MKGARGKMLIAGGSHADIPLILAAQKLGYYVITSGFRPQDPGHCVADQYEGVDFSDPVAMLALATKHKVAAVCACCNDFAALSCAYVAERLGLPGHDSYETSGIIHHKDRYREFARKHGIMTPLAQSFTDAASAIVAAQHLEYPLMVKPVDLTGGKGVVKIERMSDAEVAINNAFAVSKSKRIIIEQFIEGSNHGYTALLRNGKVCFCFADNEHYYLNKYMVSAASTPARVAKSVINELSRITEKMASILALKDGIFHVQYVLCPTGDPVIIEICRRAPGDLYIQLVQLATGVDYAACIVSAASGLGLEEVQQKDPQGFFTRHCIMTDRNGVLKHVHYSEAIRANVVDQCCWWQPGDVVENYLVHKFGIVFLRFQNADEMADKTLRMQQLIRPELTFIES